MLNMAEFPLKATVHRGENSSAFLFAYEIFHYESVKDYFVLFVRAQESHAYRGVSASETGFVKFWRSL